MSDRVDYYRALARMCGRWATARAMMKRGYSLAQARWVLLSREDYPVLRRAVNTAGMRVIEAEARREAA
jgi:hypothetical protein